VKVPRGPAAVKWSLFIYATGFIREGETDDEAEPEDLPVFFVPTRIYERWRGYSE